MELPGFDIEREIGRGGMARVYLAVQRKFGRLVALKVVSPEFSKDVNFRKRFLRESQINAQLTHPNIVQVYDVGLHDHYLFLVMEFIRGGDLNRALKQGLEMSALMNVVGDIAKALDYAHQKGFVHRDIKPENILFREDGSAVLTDFGIAKVVGADRTLTRLGTVMGTPQYMSPEQAAGRTLDGRSDLYSLGVVLYRMLTGDVPYKADSAVAVGIRHLQDPIPKLPNYFQVFQDVIDRSLAKKPEDRFQTGAELYQALALIEQHDLVPNGTIRADVVSTQEIDAVGSHLLTAQDARGERRAGEIKRRRTRRRYVLALGVALVLATAALIVPQRPGWYDTLLAVAGIGDDPALEKLWTSAQSLRGDPNQSLATIVAAYRRVLALDPDHENARAALSGLAEEWKQTIQQALTDGKLALAEGKLTESLSAFPEDPALTELAETIANRKRAGSLIASTQALLRSHGLSDIPSATAAIQAYQEALRLHPDNAVALKELNTLAGHYASLATEAAARADVNAAIGYLDRASAANAAYPELEAVREKIQQAESLRAAIDEMLQQASAHRAAGALVYPAGDNAAELYHRVLATNPDNGVASQGLNEIVSQILNTATQMLAEGRFGDVRDLVDRASAVGLDPAAVNEMKARLEAETGRLARVDQMLARARDLMRAGLITQPPDDNAVAVLRSVLRLDPGNTTAQRLLADSADRLAAVAQEAHEVGLLEEAKLYLELALAITPDVAAWRDLRDAWSVDGAE